MAKKISDLTPATELGDNDSFVFNDVAAGNDKRVTASDLRDLLQKYSVKRFGVKGDGVTDDTAAIQSVLDSNQIVYFPESDYLVTGTLTYSVNFGHLFGEGVMSRIIHQPSADDQGCFLITSDNTLAEKLHVINTQNGPAGKGTGSAFNLNNCKNSSIENCYSTSNRNSSRNGFYSNIPSVNTVDRYMIANAFAIGACEDCQILNCKSDSGTYTGIRISESKRCVADRCNIFSSFRGFMITGDESANFTVKSIIRNCVFIDCDHTGGKIETGCSDNKITGNVFDNIMTLEVTDGSGITNQGDLSVIHDNKFICKNADNSQPAVITVEGGIVSSSANVKVINNYIELSSTVTIPAIDLNDPDDGVVVENNVIKSTGGKGIVILSSNNSSIKNNYIDTCIRGIEMDLLKGCNIEFNTVKNCTNEGIRCVTGTVGNFSDTIISSNKFDACNIGILLNRAANFILVNNDSVNSVDTGLRVQNSNNGIVKNNISQESVSQNGNTSVNISDNLIAI